MDSVLTTKQGISFIEKYKKSCYVVDIYSDEWVNAQDPDEYYEITPEDLERYDHEFGGEYRGHLLALYLGDSNPELLKDLRGLIKEFDDYCNIKPSGWRVLNIPGLIFFNLKTRDILCIGLGYKNGMYSFELSKFMHAYENDLSKDKSVDCDESFYALDHHNIVKKVLKAMEQLGGNYYEYDNLPGNADVIVSLNEDDNLYYFDDYDTDEGTTTEQVDELVAEYERYSEWIDDCIDDLKAYFPKIDERWELNSGAY